MPLSYSMIKYGLMSKSKDNNKQQNYREFKLKCNLGLSVAYGVECS
jgi:hypothetical protein